MNKLVLFLIVLSFLLIQAPTMSRAEENGAKLCTVTGCRFSTVNLRSGPGTGYAKVSELYQGYQLAILGKKGRWYKVKLVDPPEEMTGWIRNNFVAFE
jgi:uncharacterized protein YgiM (DUF1202 family)